MKLNNYLSIQKFLVYLLALTILLSTTKARLNRHGTNIDVVAIYGVSTSIEELSYLPKGSLAGGTKIYITCVGQDMISTQNQVKIGPYDCIIPEKGVTENTVSCVTTEAHDQTQINNLPVELFVYGKQQSFCRGQCTFSYTQGSTPFLKFVSPNTSTPNKDINWNGKYKVSNTEDITKLVTENDKSGQFNCNRFQLKDIQSEPLNLNDDEEISATQWTNVPCTISPEQIAGLYDVTMENRWGSPIQYSTLTQITSDGSESYQLVVTPEITKISQNTSGSNGTILSIEGSGFGYISEDVIVKASGLDCEIQSVELNQITCKVAEGSTENIADPELSGQFIKGQGATVTYYNASTGTAAKLFERIRNGEIEQKEGSQQQQIGAWELSEIEENTSIKIEGYFYAPRTGTYNFWASGENTIAVYLNQNPMDQDLTSEQLIIYRCDNTDIRQYIGKNNCGTGFRSENIQLQEGNYYWMEAYIQTRGNTGHFILSVEAPEISNNSQNPITNQVPNIKQYSIVPEKDNQIWSVKVWNFDEPFGIKFFYQDQGSYEILWDKQTEEKTWQEWNSIDFQEQIEEAAGGFDPIVAEYNLDSEGNRCIITENCEEISGKEFTIEFNSYRTPVNLNQNPEFTVNIPKKNQSIKKTQEQYGQVSGYYTLRVNNEPLEVYHNKNWTTNIPHKATATQIKDGLMRQTDIQSIEVETQGSADSGYTFTIAFRSEKTNKIFSQNVDFEFENFLTSEKPGAQVQIIEKNLVNASQRILHEPVPFDMSFQPSDLPSVKVFVNNVPSAVAIGVDNSFQVIEEITPIINSYSLSDQTLDISLSNLNTVENSQIKISYGFQDCEQFNGSSCILQNPVEAGTHKPVVFIEGIGYAKINPDFIPNNVQLTQVQINNVSPDRGSIYGGIKATITGSGFSSISERTQVFFGEAQAQILDITYNQIHILVPESIGDFENQQSQQQIITVRVNDFKNNQNTFEYSKSGIPTISQISPNKASPVQKGTITITGTNFGSEEELIEVHLLKENGEIAYNLFLQSVNDTEITATLSGGSVGQYILKVFHKQTGYSLQSEEFNYSIEIHNVQPKNGSLLGGTILTITGINFSSTKVDNSVFITQDNERYNDKCVILSASETEIQCITPPKNPNFDENRSVQIYVQGRLIEESVCNGSCKFKYTEGRTPSLNEQQQQKTLGIQGNQQITVTGSNFSSSGNSATIQLAEDLIINGTVKSDTEIEFQLENIPAGEYAGLVTVDNYGYAGVLNLQVDVQISSVSHSKISNYGGFITIQGTGFSEESIVKFNKSDCKIVSFSFDEIICITPVYEGTKQKIVQVSNGDLVSNTQKVTFKELASCSLTNYQQNDNSYQIGSISFNTSEEIGFDLGEITPYLINKSNPSIKYPGQYITGIITFDNENIIAGSYNLVISIEGVGFVKFNQLDSAFYEIKVIQNLSIENTQQTGLIGGNILQINGSGFDYENIYNNHISVCGYPCIPQKEEEYSQQISCELPVVNTLYLQEERINQKYPTNKFKFLFEDEQPIYENQDDFGAYTYGKFIADTQTEENLINLESPDKSLYYISTNQNNDFCYFGYDFGEYIRVKVEEVFISMQIEDIERGNRSLIGSKVQVSNDGDNWTDIYEISESNLQSVTKILVSQDTYHRYVRFYNSVEEEDSEEFEIEKYCSLAKFELVGYSFYKEEITEVSSSFDCDVLVNVNNIETKIENKVTYSGIVSTVENIFPYYGWQLGGTEVTITGENFGNNPNSVIVKFDEINCSITSLTNTEIVCVTGDKGAQNYSSPKISIFVNGIYAVVPEGLFFYYGLLWSQDTSWGLEAAPRAGDTAFVQKGRTLIIDESSPKYIDTIINEGRIIFADKNIDFHVKYFINRQSELIIGTEFSPFSSKLTLTLYGDLDDKMLPQYGTKVIACHKCTLDIHGAAKTPNWTFLDSTVNPGESTLTTQTETNWQIGDRLAIATTDFDGKHSEEVIITGITHSSNGDDITFTPQLKYTHISVIEQYGDKTLKMQAEVGNLSRNILIQGNPENNDLNQFGGHVLLHGEGAIGRIENTEFTRTGQPRIIGRYTMHFHMVGDSRKSYIRGNSVHNAYARLVALHDVRNLEVFDNVAYWVKGHNIFLENGIEVDNKISYNLIISPRSVFNMLQTDITVAGIWATNPTNYLTYNHVAGSQFYGIWLEIFERPETPNAAHDICPMGEPIREIDHNVAHSNERFGLRIFKLAPRTFPCKDIRNKYAEDPWADNPSIESIYTNHTLYKNGESGLLAEQMGNVKFKDFILADNYYAGFQAHTANYTREDVILQDSTIIGQTQYTIDLGLEEQYSKGVQAAIVSPRTNGCTIKNVDIYNQQEDSYIFAMASYNDFRLLWVQGGKQLNVENINIYNSENAKKLRWVGYRNNIIFDKDGSFSETSLPTYITPYQPHFDQPISEGKCFYSEEYENSVLCTGTTLRTNTIGYVEKFMYFYLQTLKIINVNDQEKMARFNTTEENPEDFGTYKMRKIFDIDGGFTFPQIYATDYVYNLHWNSRLDWRSLRIQPSVLAQDDDKTIILRFNYTEKREVYDVFHRVNHELTAKTLQSLEKSRFYTPEGKPNNSPDGCTYGEYYLDGENSTVSICINNKQKSSNFKVLDITSVYCRNTCAVKGNECEKEDFERNFSNEQQWITSIKPLRKRPEDEEYQHGIPQPGDDVIIPCEWTMIFDVPEFTFGTLTIDGNLLISEEIPHIKLSANNIWVRAGKLSAGTKEFPLNNKLDIVLTGNRYSPPLVIDNISRTGTKSIAVTGRFELYGPYPEITQTRLTAQAYVGDIIIHVENDTSSWKIGDELALGGSDMKGTGFEKVKISQINGKTITLEEPLEFYHYGAQKSTLGNDTEKAYVQIDEKYGRGLDMRTVVGHLTRNIRIIGTEEDETGGHLQVYHWQLQDETENIDIDFRGSIGLLGVELEYMGQVNSENAGIHILHTNSEGELSSIQGSSIHDCFGMCMNLINTHYTEINNNVIYRGQQYLIQNLDFKYSVVTNNLLIGVYPNVYSTTFFPEVFINMYSDYDTELDGILVENNVGQSSSALGYNFPTVHCDYRDNIRFRNNETGNSKDTGIIYRFNKEGCYVGGHNQVYHSNHGLTVNSKGTLDIGIEIEQEIIVECNKGIFLRSSSKNNRMHTNILRDTYISTLVLAEICPECYNQYNQEYFRCSSQDAIVLLVTNILGFAAPLINGAHWLTVVCSPVVISSSMFINDCEFVNFRNDYYSDPIFSQIDPEICNDNRVFRTNGVGSEATAAHFLKNTKCTKCDKNGMFYLAEPNPNERGWFGGCGIMDCTGMENVMVQDVTGDFFGFVGTAISNNEDVGYGKIGETTEMQDTCDFIPAWNGFLCKRDDFLQLQWEGNGPDAQSLSTAPVYVTNDYFQNVVNMWKEWDWIGPEPQNRRKNSFVALVLDHQRHNITYSGQQPMSIIHKLSERTPTGEQDRYVIVENRYYNPLTLEVLVNDKIIEPFSFKYPEDLGLHTTECGANNYYFQNNTIHFVVTNVPTCQVLVRQVNFIQINMRIKMPQEEFLGDDNSETTFVNRIIGFLNISFDRVRIVGIQKQERRRNLEEEGEGEEEQNLTEIQVIIKDQQLPGTSETLYEPADSYNTLNQLALELNEGIENNQIEQAQGMDYKVFVVKKAGVAEEVEDFFGEEDYIEYEQQQQQKGKNSPTVEKKENSKLMIKVTLGIIFGLIGLILILLISYHFYAKRALKKVSLDKQSLPMELQVVKQNNSDSNQNNSGSNQNLTDSK